MRRDFWLAVPVLFAVVLAVRGPSDTSTARACQYVSSTSASELDFAFHSARILAVGRFSRSSAERITFTVEEPLQGTSTGMEYVVDNRFPLPEGNCGSAYSDSKLPGNRFDDGERAILGLAGGENGVWRPGQSGELAWPFHGDELQPLTFAAPFPDWPIVPDPIKLTDVRSRMVASQATPFDAGYEARGPCNGAGFSLDSLPIYVADSTLVGVAHVQGSDDTATTLLFDEVFRGTLPERGSVTVNDHALRPNSGSCKRELGDRGRYQIGESLLVFLRPDDYGVAEYQPSVFGNGMMRVNERYVVYSSATLGDFRATAARLGAGKQTGAGPGQDEQDLRGIALAAALSAVIAVAVLYGASRTSARSRR